MLAISTRPAVAGTNGKPAYHTVTALKRWSCDDKDLPSANEIRAIHVYDFDNTRTLGLALCIYITDKDSFCKSPSKQATMEQCHDRPAG